MGPARPAPAHKKLTDLIETARFVSGCDDESLLERASCYKEFSRKAVKAGTGIALFAYAIHEGHKDSVEHFGNTKKEAAKLGKLKKELQRDPAKITDPAEREEAVAQVRATLNGAKKDIDNALKQVYETIETITVMITVVLMTVKIILELAQIVGDQDFSDALNATTSAMKGISKDLDEINAGLAQMSTSLDEMNAAVDQVNKGLSQMNRGIDRANKGMDQLNRGITRANKGMNQLNQHVPGIAEGAGKLGELPGVDVDFSGLDDLWDTESDGVDLAEQDRRMGLLLDLMPGIGDGKGIIEAVTGKDLASGRQLNGTERALGALSVLRWLKAGSKRLTPDDVRGARRGDHAVPCTPNSFIPSTPVLMADGSHRPIAQVAAGEQVLARDPATGRTTPKPVTRHITGQGAKDLVRLTVDTGGSAGAATDSITATDEHPFWTPGSGRWTEAADITPGTWLRTSAGTKVQITAVRAWTASDQTVHNLTVADLHTYYVLAGETPVLVHNSNGWCGVDSAEAQDIIKNAQGYGSGLKRDADHRAADFVVDDIAKKCHHPTCWRRRSRAAAGSNARRIEREDWAL